MFDYLEECSTCIVDRFDKIGVGDTDSNWPKTDDIAVLFMQSPLCFDMSLSVMIEKPPDV